MKQEEYIGKTYNRLTILSFGEPKIVIRKDGYPVKITVVNCICSCGNLWSRMLTSIKNNNTKSCGCFNKEQTAKKHKTHNLSGIPEYNTWTCMKDRCSNSKCPSYHNYGGRGITVCEEWINSFETFITDMGRKPSKQHTIDRIDNNLGYFKENCRWATWKEQNNNRRDARIIIYQGKSKNMKEWCEELNLNYSVTWIRLTKLNWTVEDAFKK